MKNFFLSVLLLLVSFTATAQREADKVLRFDDKVKNLVIVPFNGIALISTAKKITAYDQDSEQIIWEIAKPSTDLAKDATKQLVKVFSKGLSADSFNVASNDFKIIPDTPFLQLLQQNKLFIINSFNGEYVFKSKDTDPAFFDSEYIFDEDAILLRGIKDENLIISKYKIKEGKYLWETKLADNYQDLASKFNSALGDDITSVGRDRFELVADKIFILAKGQLFAIKNDSGDLLWKQELGEYSNFFVNNDASYVLISTGKIFKTEIFLRKANDGSAVWEKPIKTKSLVLFEDWSDKMLLAHYKGFNFYEYETGKKRWEKDPKGKNIKSVIPQGSDFLYVYDDEMMLLDRDGQKKWKKDVKICDDEEDPIFFLEKTKNGKVLYVTATYANLVDYNTGEKIWKGNLKLNEKRPTFAKFDENTGDFIIYNDEELYRFNENTTEKPKAYAKLKLKNEKTISSMEIFDNNVSITGQSEVVGVDASGAVVFHNKYSQPGELGRKFLKAGIAIGNTASAIASTKVEVYSVNKDANGNIISQDKIGEIGFSKKTQQLGEAGYLAGSIGKELIKDRFNALQQTDKFAIIFGKGENKEKLLVRIDKESGKEIDKIIVENNKPIYSYDAVSKGLFYSKKNEVMIFKAK